MRVSLRWLAEFVDLPVSDPIEIGRVLGNLGLAVEGTDHYPLPFSGVVTARVTAIRPHPDAERLRLVTVDRGGESQEVVCGAWNFEVGDLVPLAAVGAVLAGGLEVGARTIRGVVSEGMICSAAELGLGDDAAGILILGDGTPGEDFAASTGLPDTVLDLEITSNRPDAMSVHGVARELAAHYGLTVRLPATGLDEQGPASTVVVDIDDPDGCPRYVGREVRDVQVGPSPVWIQQRLRMAGVRPINNVVDVTNYVLLELGQPIHGFDLDRLEQGTIVVRRAGAGERLLTLDGVERELDPNDLVIADAVRPVALAGVMGGEETEVGPATTRVLIEAAHFDPVAVLFTSRRHGLRTEASARFERGVDPSLPDLAARRVARLLTEVAGATAVSGARDAYPKPIEPRTLRLDVGEAGRLLGIDVGRDRASDLLARLGMTVTGDTVLTVTVPTHRPDLTRPADLIEEIARVNGYDAIPETLPAGRGGGRTPSQRRERVLRRALTGAGYCEAQTSTFVGPADLLALGLAPDDPRRLGIRVSNPLRDEEGLLRTTLLPGLLKAAAFNAGHDVTPVALFEVGRVFLPEPSPVYPRLPHQPTLVGFLAWGAVGESGLSTPARPADVFRATATLDVLAAALGLEVAVEQDAPVMFHPGRAVRVLVDGSPVGVAGEIHPAVARAFGLEGRVAAGELLLEPLTAPQPLWQLDPPSLFPPVVFDLAFETAAETAAGELVAAVGRHAGPMLETAGIFDVFSGSPLPPGRKSLAVRLVFRASDRTLTDEEVAPLRAAVISGVEHDLDARLRGA